MHRSVDIVCAICAHLRVIPSLDPRARPGGRPFRRRQRRPGGCPAVAAVGVLRCQGKPLLASETVRVIRCQGRLSRRGAAAAARRGDLPRPPRSQRLPAGLGLGRARPEWVRPLVLGVCAGRMLG